ncbi:Epidermal growth factor receptor kinase substrate 8-like protein 3 [Aphelenchoides besseyi]|nr:Epidermal growth factor receptor kinase substrate 8-like protein 3 [Aphelenchoides besseyi]
MFDSRLPFIPPPDYTVRVKPKIATQKLRDDHGQPHHYQPQIRPNRRSLTVDVDDEPTEEPRSQSPDEVKRRVLRMIKEHGVPVFPIAGPKEVVEQGTPAALGPTRAYIKHLENHRKYDTLNSFRSCDNCALCKQMQEEIDILEHGVSRKRPQAAAQNRRPQPRPERAQKTRSALISGKLFEPLREEDEPAEPEESAEIVVARVQNRHRSSIGTNSTASPPEQRRRIVRVPEAKARRDYAAATDQQLSVRMDEKLKVLQTDTIWSLCTRSDGAIGWTPTANLLFL